MTTILLGIGFIGLFFVFMSVRLLFIKDGQFKGTCASQNPYLNKEGATCGFCGRTMGEGEACGKDEMQENEVDKVISRYE